MIVWDWLCNKLFTVCFVVHARHIWSVLYCIIAPNKSWIVIFRPLQGPSWRGAFLDLYMFFFLFSFSFSIRNFSILLIIIGYRKVLTSNESSPCVNKQNHVIIKFHVIGDDGTWQFESWIMAGRQIANRTHSGVILCQHLVLNCWFIHIFKEILCIAWNYTRRGR